MSLSRLGSAGLALAALLLNACTPLQMQASRQLSPTAPGALVLRMSSNQLVTARTNASDAVLVVNRRDPRPGEVTRRYTLESVAVASLNSQAYGGALPPGNYELSQIIVGNAFAMLANSGLGSFHVEAGRITYLGNVQQLTLPPSPGRTSERVLFGHEGAQTKADEGKDLVEEHFPAFVNLLDRPFLGWDPGSFDAAMMRQRHLVIRMNSAGHYGMLDLGDEGVLFGNQGGIIRVIRPGKRARHLDTGMPYAVRALAHLPDGTLLAGGEQGLFKFSRDQGKTWRPMLHALPEGTVHSIKVGADATIYITHVRRGQVTVYKGRMDVTQWSPLYTRPAGRWMRPLTFRQEGSLVLVPEQRTLVLIDLATGTAIERQLPGFARSFSVAPDGRLFCECAGGPTLGANGVGVSSDGGQSWTPLALPKTVEAPYFRDALHGITTERKLVGMSRFHVTSDGGTTWTPGETSAQGALLGHTSDGRTLYAQGTRGLLYASTDDGRSWDLADASE